MAKEIARAEGMSIGDAMIGQFPNHERYVSIRTNFRGRECMVLGGFGPTDAELVSILQLCHTLKKDGADSVTALIPYLGYMRQDRDEPGRSLGAEWVGRMLKSCGVDSLITVDIHSWHAAEFCFPALHSISPAPLFAQALNGISKDDLTIVAPDEGAVGRAEDMRWVAGIDRPVVYLKKTRESAHVRHVQIVGDPGANVLVVDDILDTGGTLVSCCRLLRDAGVQSITAAVTHGLFTGNAWPELWSLGVTDIYCTDSIPAIVPPVDSRIHVLPIGALLKSHVEGSVFGQAPHSLAW